MKLRVPQSRRQQVVIGATIAALLVVGTMLWIRFMAPPTKQDYASAAGQARDVKRATSAANESTAKYVLAVISSLRMDPTAKELESDAIEARADYDEAFGRYDTLLDGLESSPVRRDTDVKKPLSDALRQSAEFKRSFSDLTAMYPAFYRTFISCEDVRRFVAGPDAQKNFAEFTAQSDDCLRDLTQLDKSNKIKSIADYSRQRTDVITEQRAAYESLTRNDVNVSVVTQRLNELQAKATMLDPLAVVQAERARAVDTTKLDALTKLLDDKART